MHSLELWNNKPFLTWNGSLGFKSCCLKNGSDWYSLTNVLVRFDPGIRVEIAPMNLVFLMRFLISSLKYSLVLLVLDICRERPSAACFDFSFDCNDVENEYKNSFQPTHLSWCE